MNLLDSDNDDDENDKYSFYEKEALKTSRFYEQKIYNLFFLQISPMKNTTINWTSFSINTSRNLMNFNWNQTVYEKLVTIPSSQPIKTYICPEIQNLPIYKKSEILHKFW